MNQLNPYPEQVVVVNANYQVLGDGTVTYDLMTSPQVHPTTYMNSAQFHTLPHIENGNIYALTENNGQIIWTCQGNSGAFPGPKIYIDELNVCPVCGQQLMRNKIYKYCINDACLAKIQVGIHRFLFFSGLELSMSEKQAIDVLIGNKIRHPAHLFALTEQNLIDIDFPTRIQPAVLIGKLKSIKMTIGAFLSSINIPGIYRDPSLYVDVNLIDSTFKNIRSLMDWMTGIQIEASNTHSEVSAEPYMSNEFFENIHCYFLFPPNYSGAIALEEFGIFS